MTATFPETIEISHSLSLSDQLSYAIKGDFDEAPFHSIEDSTAVSDSEGECWL